MCGIFGAISNENILNDIKPALNKLAYRGYDSAGICWLESNSILIKKTIGHPELLPDLKGAASVAIGHNRWATHGKPTKLNAHPHISNNKKIAVIHNGIIENYFEIKKELKKNGFSFYSETDTEVIPNLIQYYLKNNKIEEAILKTCNRIRGAYAIVIISLDNPDKLYAARLGSPLSIGFSDKSFYISSDHKAFPLDCNRHAFIDDKTVLSIDRGGSIKTKSFAGKARDLKILALDAEELTYSLGKYETFMEKEIWEQPIYSRSAISGRINANDYSIKLSGIKDCLDDILSASQIIFTGCGSALYAAEIGAYAMESFAKIPCRSISAGELKYFNAAIDKKTIIVAVSQSGETADTLGCIKQAKNLGAKTIGIVNTPGSSISREVDCGLYIRAGYEKSVASTKAVINQIIAMIEMALLIGQKRGMNKELYRSCVEDLLDLPQKIKDLLSLDFLEISNFLSGLDKFVIIGRGPLSFAAKEIALKIKEISYIHCEAYSASELKHGPLALIDKNCPTLVLSCNDGLQEKLISNMKEIKSRNGSILSIYNNNENIQIKELSQFSLNVPKFKSKCVSAIIMIVAGQIIAYNIAKILNKSIDRPRNLAKSVTVE